MHRALGLALAATTLSACIPDNPPVVREIQWVDAKTEDLARRACYDCHSNETVWPWYTRVPIVRGLVIGDVERGREELNFSDWDHAGDDAWEAPEEVLEGEMPLELYVKHHPEADLSDAERADLADGMERTFQVDPPAGEPEDEDEDDDD